MTKRDRLIAATRCQPVDEVPISTGYLDEWQNDWKLKDPAYREIVLKSREIAYGTFSWEPVPVRLRGTDMEPLYSSDPVSCPFIYSFTSANIKVERIVHDSGNTREIKTTIHTPKGPIHNICKIFDGIQTIWQPKHFIETDDELERFFSMPVEDIKYDCSGFEQADRYIGDNGVVLVVIPDPLYYAADLFHSQDFVLRAYDDSNTFLEIMNRFRKPVMDRLKQMLSAGACPLFRIAGPEYATPPFLGKEMFRKYVTEFDKEIVDTIHESGQLVRLHSHSNVRDVLDEFLRLGVDGTDPLEGPPDGNVTIREARKILRDKISIWGNVELKHLETMTPDEVDAMVRNVMEEGKESYGFIIMPTAEPITQPLPEKIGRNYVQYLESAKKYAKY